jgi:hypothetical protein
VAVAMILTLAPLGASDHADPIDLLNRQRLEGGITDLFFFPRTDEKGVRRMEVILCVRRALTQAGSLMLEPYTYTIYMDLDSTVTFDNDQQLKRYGGTVDRPDGISPTVTIPIHLTSKAEFRERPVITGLRGDLKDPDRIKVSAGVFDDPFIFPTFFGTNTVGMVLSIPLDAFPNNQVPEDQQHWLLWATSSRDGKQIDHVGRSLRTQNPRFDMLNTLPPQQHVAAIKAEREHPSLMRDVFLRLGFQQVFAFRQWDHVPDVMIYSPRSPVGFPNGRLLTDDVAELLAVYGDTLLKEISHITGGWPRATKNDMDFLSRDKTHQEVPENLIFPYLASPWPEKKPNPPLSLTDSNETKLWLIALGLVALFVLENWLVAMWYHRKQLRRRYL